MTSKRVGMHEAKTQLSQLVRDLESGAVPEIVITRSGKPVARLVAPEAPTLIASSRGMFKGQLWMSDDFNEDDGEMARLFGTAD